MRMSVLQEVDLEYEIFSYMIYKVVKTDWDLRSYFKRYEGVRIGLYADELRILVERNTGA